MMKARIENNTVVEILNLDPFPPFHPSLIWVECDESTECGDIYINNVFSKPIEITIVPKSITKFQGRAALAQTGYFTMVDSYMNTLPIDNITRIAWNDAAVFDRDSPTVLSMATMLNLTPTQVDDLFRLASNITA